MFVKIMFEVNPFFECFVVTKNSGKALYLLVVKALYGCIDSALLWYNLYITTLEKMGFKINQYGRCIANKCIDGHQCTLVWYVDDSKLFHINLKFVDAILDEMKKHFGDITITRGKKHSFLIMNISFTTGKKEEILMKDQVQETISMSP